MQAYTRSVAEVERALSVDKNIGLTDKAYKENKAKFGENILSQKKQKTLFNRVIDALFEPMMIILLFAFAITLGINIARQIKSGDGEFYECIGIFIAIFISVFITVIMEGKSQRAFELLRGLESQGTVKVMRNGKLLLLKTSQIVVGDVVFIEAGNKIPADGRLVESNFLKVDESTLTGESKGAKKEHGLILPKDTPLIDRANMVFGGTYVLEGNGAYIVTSVGDSGEIGKIAKDLGSDKKISAPLNQKLARLGKMVSIFGVTCSAFVFILSLVRLIILKGVTFESVQDIFIQSIILIVAAVPEGLPTTVALSLTLNVVRLAKSNALIKKLVATETIGAVSVICSDKTGTLTKNQMQVYSVVSKNSLKNAAPITDKYITQNMAVNSTAELFDRLSVKRRDNKKVDRLEVGSKTECALLHWLKKGGLDYKKMRKSGAISLKTPFSSKYKYMETAQILGGKSVLYLKGAPEVVLDRCKLYGDEKSKLLQEIEKEQATGARLLAFAHDNGGGYVFDGYVVLGDSLRDDVKDSITACQRVGVKVKILTGDNVETAKYIARAVGLDTSKDSVMSAEYIDGLTDTQLKGILENITVIARSTPATKLRVVKLLQQMDEVVAVTGDGVNDAPAIKHADIGIAMGDGAEITKQASDVILLDNSFNTILKAISFGRNVFANFQRFIMFQLTVNLSSMSIIIAFLLMGLESPFSSTTLLWLNIIMDGPLALSLALEKRPLVYSGKHPVKRSADILGGKMLVRIGIHSLVTCLAVCLQQKYNFLGFTPLKQSAVIVTMFVFFQVFNAINCREPRTQSAVAGLFSNKLLIAMILLTFSLHIILIGYMPWFFGTHSLSIKAALKIALLCVLFVPFSELYKAVYRCFLKTQRRPEKLKSGAISPKTAQKRKKCA